MARLISTWRHYIATALFLFSPIVKTSTVKYSATAKKEKKISLCCIYTIFLRLPLPIETSPSFTSRMDRHRINWLSFSVFSPFKKKKRFHFAPLVCDGNSIYANDFQASFIFVSIAQKEKNENRMKYTNTRSDSTVPSPSAYHIEIAKWGLERRTCIYRQFLKAS